LIEANAGEHELNKQLEVLAAEEERLVIAHVAHGHPKDVVDQVRVLLAHIARDQEVGGRFDDEVEGLHKEVVVLGLVAELGKAKLDGINKGAERVALVPEHRLLEERVQEGQKLVAKRPL
jgi:hypothetical protein